MYILSEVNKIFIFGIDPFQDLSVQQLFQTSTIYLSTCKVSNRFDLFKPKIQRFS